MLPDTGPPPMAPVDWVGALGLNQAVEVVVDKPGGFLDGSESGRGLSDRRLVSDLVVLINRDGSVGTGLWVPNLSVEPAGP